MTHISFLITDEQVFDMNKGTIVDQEIVLSNEQYEMTSLYLFRKMK